MTTDPKTSAAERDAVLRDAVLRDAVLRNAAAVHGGTRITGATRFGCWPDGTPLTEREKELVFGWEKASKPARPATPDNPVYREGYDAFSRGLSAADCPFRTPFDRETGDSQAWLAGYADAVRGQQAA